MTGPVLYCMSHISRVVRAGQHLPETLQPMRMRASESESESERERERERKHIEAGVVVFGVRIPS